MADFIVRIDTSKLSEKQADKLAAAIQGTVLAELARIDAAPVAAARQGIGGLVLHPEWRGIWLRNLKDLVGGKQPALVVTEKGI